MLSRLRFPLIRLVSVVLLAALAIAGEAGQAFAEDQLSISSAPAANGTIDKERSRFTYQVDPGQSISDEYFVENSGSTPQLVSIYATDAYNSKDGNFALLDTGVPSADVGSWVTFDGGATRVDLTLQPGEFKVLTFTVNVPAEATPGDHAGGIVVSALTDSGQVKLDRRIATRLYVRVKGELQALMTIGNLDASYEPSLNPFGGRVNMTFTLTNTGNVSLGADTVSRITGIFGIPFSGDSRVAVPELLPGTSRTVSIPVEGVGQWMFLSASVDLVGTIDNDAINPGPLPTAKRDVMIFAMPWFALVVLILGVALYFGLRAKRRRDAVRAQEWLDFAAATAAAEAAAEAAAAKKTAIRTKSAETKKPDTTTRPRKSDNPS